MNVNIMLTFSWSINKTNHDIIFTHKFCFTRHAQYQQIPISAHIVKYSRSFNVHNDSSNRSVFYSILSMIIKKGDITNAIS